MLRRLPRSHSQPRTSGAPDFGSEAAISARIEEYRAAVEIYKAQRASAADLLGHYTAEDWEHVRKHAAAMEAWTSAMQPIIAARAPGAAAALTGQAQPGASANTNPTPHAPLAQPAVAAADRTAQPRALGDPHPSPQGPPAPSVEALARARARDRVRRPIVPYDDSDYDELQGSLPPRAHASAMASEAPSTAELAASEATRGGAEPGSAATARCGARRLKSMLCFQISDLSFQGRHTIPDLFQKRQCYGRSSYGCRQTQALFFAHAWATSKWSGARAAPDGAAAAAASSRRARSWTRTARQSWPAWIHSSRPRRGSPSGRRSSLGGRQARGPSWRGHQVDALQGQQLALGSRLRKCSP